MTRGASGLLNLQALGNKRKVKDADTIISRGDKGDKQNSLLGEDVPGSGTTTITREETTM